MNNIISSNFLNENFFIIDSNNIDHLYSKIYGFIITDTGIFNNSNFKQYNNIQLDSSGVYIIITRKKNSIEIYQDFNGSFGLHLYRNKEYFAISNSFLYLFDYLKNKVELTFNRDYANHLIATDLAALSYNETMINEIQLLPRDEIIKINLTNKSLEFEKIDYKENSLFIDSEEGLNVIDNWFFHWTQIIKAIKNNMIVDLSGGFDSRLAFMLVLKSGVDVKNINIRSINDKLHCHNEDFEIANQIANKFNFTINKTDLLQNKSINLSFEEIINSYLYNKLIYHKQVYYPYTKFNHILYHITGGSGESLRAHWDITPLDFIKHEITRIEKNYTKYTSEKLIKSITKIVNNAFNIVQNKYNITDINSTDITTNFYNETRNRHHFGKSYVESYFANIYKLSPLTDPNLHKLKTYSSKCSDKNLLIALIFSRYCKELLDFKFEGGRFINKETINYANFINSQIPPSHHLVFDSLNNITLPINTNDVDAHSENHNYSKDPNVFFKNIFNSKKFYKIITSYFDEEIYFVASNYLKNNNFFPLQKCYPLFAIVIILQNLNAIKYTKNISHFKNLCNFTSSPVYKSNNKIIDCIKYFITARIDIQLISKNANFNIESYDNYIIEEPKWMQQEGKGCLIHSNALAINFKILFHSDGILKIYLRGEDVRINGCKITYWIDYKKFTYNNDIVFDSITSVWHDRPFIFTKFVKKNETAHCFIEWLPHLDTRK